jgi:hypothetical protein
MEHTTGKDRMPEMNPEGVVNAYSTKAENSPSENDRALLKRLVVEYGRYVYETVDAYYKARDNFFDFKI